MDNVTIVVRYDPTAAGPFVIEVFEHAGDAAHWVQRQTDPTQYELVGKTVRHNDV